jgi:DNA-binding NtrC family response regulator
MTTKYPKRPGGPLETADMDNLETDRSRAQDEKHISPLGVSHSHRSVRANMPIRLLRGRTRTFATYTPEMFPILDELELVASHDVTVLIIGETGSGKTYLSQLIHELSPRHSERFLPLACGTLPPDLIESELFGHVRGAFTSAHTDKVGKFAAAGRGTLLLDEIDLLGPEQQAKLLRVIETGEYEPVGSNTTQVSQARLIVASNQDLDPLVQQHRFRQDLYYRLNVLKFHLLPLRERKADLVPLTEHFVSVFAKLHGVSIDGIDPEFHRAIDSYSWPGNIRELENAIRRSIILCRTGRLTPAGLPTSVIQNYRIASDGASAPAPAGSQGLNHYVALTEREVIEDALRRSKFKRAAAARSLGISRVTLYNKMRKYGLSNQRATPETESTHTGSQPTPVAEQRSLA